METAISYKEIHSLMRMIELCNHLIDAAVETMEATAYNSDISDETLEIAAKQRNNILTSMPGANSNENNRLLSAYSVFRTAFDAAEIMDKNSVAIEQRVDLRLPISVREPKQEIVRTIFSQYWGGLVSKISEDGFGDKFWDDLAGAVEALQAAGISSNQEKFSTNVSICHLS